MNDKSHEASNNNCEMCPIHECDESKVKYWNEVKDEFNSFNYWKMPIPDMEFI